MKKRLHIWVTGRVQGVSYRAGTCKRARALGLTGWVRNLNDGRVELVAEGEAEAVDSLKAWCAKGTWLARVDTLACDELQATGEYTEFRVV